MKTIAIAFVAAFLPFCAGAATFKCVARDGSVTYQGEPCPDTGNEKKMQDPAAGPTGSAASAKPGLKEGWTKADLAAMAESCVAVNLGAAKREFESAAKTQASAPQFPEAELTSGLKTMCACFADRIGATHTLDDFHTNPQSILKKMNDEAVAGGACKPEGALGEAMQKNRQ